MSDKRTNLDQALDESGVMPPPLASNPNEDSVSDSVLQGDFDPFTISPRIDFDEQETLSLLIHARAAVESTVCGESFLSKLPPGLDEAHAHGIFVTLLRGVMRSCKGQWANHKASTIGVLLTDVARAAATKDLRLPSITEDELPYLKIDISFIHDVQTLAREGPERAGQVQVGLHGVFIRREKRKKSILLPQVAVENRWDARTFLEQASAAAGLPKDAWMDPATIVKTFQTHVIRDEPIEQEFNPKGLSALDMSLLLANANSAMRGEARNEAIRPLLANKYEHELGVQLFNKSGATGFACAKGRSLIDLTRSAARSMLQMLKQKNQAIEPLVRLQVLWQPTNLLPGDYPERHATLVHSTIVAWGKNSWTVIAPKPGHAYDTVAHALSRLNITHDQWAEGAAKLTAFGTTGFNLKPPE
jgi:uncharacterized protein